jgi:hypothetical protein
VTGRDGFPRAGYSTGDSQEMPVDLAAMQADDTLLDILGAGGAPGDASDELTRVLAGWRREVDAEPVGELGGHRHRVGGDPRRPPARPPP